MNKTRADTKDGEENVKKRDCRWDNLKALLITLVVVGHFIDVYTGDSRSMRSIFLLIYFFHMPLFLFISGLFSKKFVDGEYVRKEKIIYLLVLYILMGGAVFFCNLFLEGKVSYSLYHEQGIQWYVFALAVFYLLTYYLKEMDKKLLLPLSVFVGCIAGYDSTIGDTLTLSRILVFYPFFLWGYYSDLEKLSDKLKRPALRIGAGVFLIFYCFAVFWKTEELYILRPLLSGRNPYRTLGDYAAWGGLLRLGCYGITAVVSLSVAAVIPGCKTILTGIGRRTLQVYCIHTIVLSVLCHYQLAELLQRLFSDYWKVSYILSAVLLTWILSLRKIEKPFFILAGLCGSGRMGSKERGGSNMRRGEKGDV